MKLFVPFFFFFIILLSFSPASVAGQDSLFLIDSSSDSNYIPKDEIIPSEPVLPQKRFDDNFKKWEIERLKKAEKENLFAFSFPIDYFIAEKFIFGLDNGFKLKNFYLKPFLFLKQKRGGIRYLFFMKHRTAGPLLLFYS